MKKTFLILLIIHCSLLITYAQWQPEQQLTTDLQNSETSFNNSKKIAVYGDVVHVVWMDNRNGDKEIYYKRSPDGGSSWGNDIRLVYTDGNAKYPVIAVTEAFVHVAWQDSRDGNDEIYYKRSLDGGLSWSGDVRITNNSAGSGIPAVFAMKYTLEYVFLVWQDTRDGNAEIYYRRSVTGGATFQDEMRLSTLNPSDATMPSINCCAMSVHVVWMDNRDGNFEIYYKRTTNSGINWSDDTRLTNNPSESEYACLSLTNQFIAVVWTDSRDGNEEIYLKSSSNNGANWSSDKRLTNNSAISTCSSLFVAGQTLHVVWHDGREPFSEIYYKRSPDEGLSWGSDVRLTNDPGFSIEPSICIFGPAVYVVWTDYHGVLTNGDVYFKKDPTGNPIGIKQISSEIPEHFNLYQNCPNPFNPNTVISFQLAVNSYTKLIIYDILGIEISTLVNEQLKPGTYEVKWDGSNYPSGVYCYTLSTDDYKETKKMILIK